MASELINAVLEVENECRKRESDAKKQADIKKQDTQRKAQQLVVDAEKQVGKMLKDDYAAISDSSERQLEKQKVKIQKECDELSEKAAKNLDRVTRLVIKMLTS